MRRTTISLPLATNTSITVFGIYALSFIIPLAFAAPQIVIGTLVNTLLFLSTKRVSLRHLWPIAVVPSLGAVAHGVLFGPYTVFLWYFLPAIWVGNALLMRASLWLSRAHPVVRIGASSLLKYLWLSALASVFVSLHIVPPLFRMSMGVIQLVTALIGGLVAYGIDTYTTRVR